MRFDHTNNVKPHDFYFYYPALMFYLTEKNEKMQLDCTKKLPVINQSFKVGGVGGCPQLIFFVRFCVYVII